MDVKTEKPTNENTEGVVLSRKEIFDLLQGGVGGGGPPAYEKIEKHIRAKTQKTFTLTIKGKTAIRKLIHDFKKRWKRCAKREDQFYYNYSSWLRAFVRLEGQGGTEKAGKTKTKLKKPPIMDPTYTSSSSREREDLDQQIAENSRFVTTETPLTMTPIMNPTSSSSTSREHEDLHRQIAENSRLGTTVIRLAKTPIINPTSSSSTYREREDRERQIAESSRFETTLTPLTKILIMDPISSSSKSREREDVERQIAGSSRFGTTVTPLLKTLIMDPISSSATSREREDVERQIAESARYETYHSLTTAAFADKTTESPSRVKKQKKSIKSTSEISLSADAALSLIVEQKLSRSQYKGLRNASIKNYCNFFPSYKQAEQAKLGCYPKESDIRVTECSAEVKLQSLLNHTIERILLTLTDVVATFSKAALQRLYLICNWGANDSPAQSICTQESANDDGSKSNDNIFIMSLVPMQLISVDEKNILHVLWKNPRPSSPRFCRPIRIQYFDDSTKAVFDQMHRISPQTQNLVPYESVINGREIKVHFDVSITKIDDSICSAFPCNAAEETCYLCNETLENFRYVEIMREKEINEGHPEFGLSIPHLWIRFFECFLHIGYKLEIAQWQESYASQKESVKNRKASIQKGFRTQLGLVVDRPKPGFASSNDADTARKFFENASTSASITGVNVDLIKRFHVILQVLSCGHEINLTKFQDYALQTARDYVISYWWFHMPISMHKILIHGPRMIRSAILPIGQMSEFVQESNNKYIERYRRDVATESSRKENMKDIFLRSLVTSDPFISSLRELPSKKLRSLLPEAVQLLTEPHGEGNKKSCSYHTGDLNDSESASSSSDDDY